jgi:hypothetical protein
VHHSLASASSPLRRATSSTRAQRTGCAVQRWHVKHSVAGGRALRPAARFIAVTGPDADRGGRTGGGNYGYYTRELGRHRLGHNRYTVYDGCNPAYAGMS